MDKERLRKLLAFFCTLAITVVTGKVLIYLAYMARGYEAFGGEYLLIPVVCWIVWKAINFFLDKLEDIDDARACEKGRGRIASRIQDNR